VWFNRKIVVFFFVFIALSLFFQNCKTKQKSIISSSNNSLDIDTVHPTYGKIIPDYTSLKYKVKYKSGEDENNATAFIKVKKDSIVWISLQVVLGIEVSRITIEKDSFKFINKIEKNYKAEKNERLQSEFGFPLDYNLIQNIIFANNYFLNSNYTVFEQGIFSKNAFIKQESSIDEQRKINNTLYTVLNDGSTMFIEFKSYLNYEKNTYPQKIICNIKRENETYLELELQNINFEPINAFPFNIPKNYTKL